MIIMKLYIVYHNYRGITNMHLMCIDSSIYCAGCEHCRDTGQAKCSSVAAGNSYICEVHNHCIYVNRARVLEYL